MRSISLLALLLLPSSFAQDLYDTTVLRTIELTFASPDWQSLLRQNYQSQTYLTGDLTMEGVTYPDVGVRIRGNTSYTALPQGCEKFSLGVALDLVHPGQKLLGHDTLNLNNAFVDPTFCREVALHNFMARFIPCGRGNHVVLTINGQNWGVYANIEQYDKNLLRRHFVADDGLRFKCVENTPSSGLRYVGPNPNAYQGYEIKNDGGLANPVAAIIAVCDAVTNGSQSDWRQIDAVFAVDPSIWACVLENLLADDDGYIEEGRDFVCYRNPLDGRTHLHQSDGNEGFHVPTWAVDRNFSSPDRPLLSHVLAIPELRQRYMAHMRTALEQFSWTLFDAEFTAYRNLIDSAVLADPKRMSSYQDFLDNFTTTVNVSGIGPSGGTAGGDRGIDAIGLHEFVIQRAALLATDVELNAEAPTIDWSRATPSAPDPLDDVYITARVTGPAAGIDTVELFYLATPGPYQRVPMSDDGLSGDGAAGDGVYGALLPIVARPGQSIAFHVVATAADVYGSISCSPPLSELRPSTFAYNFVGPGMKITEYLYTGADGEFVELTNTGPAAIDLSGWSVDDQTAMPGAIDLSAAGLVAPGASIVITGVDPVAFGSAWGLSGVTVIGLFGSIAFGRNDQVNLYDASGALADRLTYGDQTFPGSVRAREQSAHACDGALGTDDPYLWTLAVVGDAWGSVQSIGGDRGSPGTYTVVPCPSNGAVYCISNPNSTGQVAALSVHGSVIVARNDVALNCAQLPAGSFGYFLTSRIRDMIPGPSGSQGILCLGDPVGRFDSQLQSSGGAGAVAIVLDLIGVPSGTGVVAVLAGETWNFQYWFRDTSSGAATSNFSTAIAVSFH